MGKNATKSVALCAFVDETMFVDGEGYRVAIVREGEPGYHPTGTWPYTGAPDETRPWFWGRTKDGFSIDAAREQVDEYNERLGVSRKRAFEIVASSMFRQRRARR